MTVRTTAQRVADAQRQLAEVHDVWFATASDNRPYLVPFSLLWDDATSEIVVSTLAKSPTVRNLEAGGTRIRVSLPSTAKVLIFDGEARVVGPVEDDDALGDAFAARCGWDPRNDPGRYVFIRFRPERALAWNHEGELKGRTIMRDGLWLE
jgi:hypothetical protein